MGLRKISGAIVCVLVLTILFRAANNMVQTTTPLLIESALHGGSLEVGVIAAVFAFAVVIAAMSVARHVRPARIQIVVLAAFILFTLTMPLFALVSSVWQVAALMALSGFVGGILQPFLLTLTATHSSPRTRDRNLGLFSLALSASLLVGPMLETATLGVDHDRLRPVFVIFALTGVAAIALSAWMVLAARRGPVDPASQTVALGPPSRYPLRRLAHNQTYLLALVGNATYVIPFALLVAFGGTYAHLAFHSTYSAVQVLFAGFYAASFVARGIVSYRAPLAHKRAVLVLSLVLTIAGLLTLGLTQGAIAGTLAFILLGVPHGLTYPVATSLIADSVSGEELGFANSLFGSAGGVVGLIVPLLAGVLITRVGYHTLFALAALAVGAICVLLLLWIRPHTLAVRTPRPTNLVGAPAPDLPASPRATTILHATSCLRAPQHDAGRRVHAPGRRNRIAMPRRPFGRALEPDGPPTSQPCWGEPAVEDTTSGERGS
ncbi:MAG: MFS transporter [Ktedonobacterales bacterium]